LKYGTTITLWSDDFVYAFLRIATDDVALVVINNGYLDMPTPIRLKLNTTVIPQRVAAMIAGLEHWRSGEALQVHDGHALVRVAGKTIDIFVAH
jgi:alpha-amylase